MINFQAVGFVAILGIAGAGLDYTQQSRKAGLDFGEMGVQDYVDTITGRFAGMTEGRALQQRQKQLAKIHLPKAPDGWARREWPDGDNSRIMPPEREITPEEAHARKLMAGPLARDAKLAARRQRKEIWVYEKDNEIISLAAVYKKPNSGNSPTDLGMQMIVGNMQGMFEVDGYAVIQGVSYGEEMGMFGEEEISGFRSFYAHISDKITIRIRAKASDDTIRLFMESIDYDGLNAMLTHPMENVGSSASEIDLAMQAKHAQQVLDQQRGEVSQKGQAAEQKLMERRAGVPTPAE